MTETMAEKAVQTAKRIVMKATTSGRDPYIALLEYRSTPISDCGKSPAQLLMSRRLRYILPSTPTPLQLVPVNQEDTQLRFDEKQEKQKTFYDRNARTREPQLPVIRRPANPQKYLWRTFP